MYLFFIVNIMKKFWLLWILLLVIFVAGCSWFWKKENAEERNVAKAEINVESCNDYFELVNCIIDNDTDNSYSAEDREVIRDGVNDMRESWATLDDDTLDQMCSAEISKFDWMKEYLSEIGCSLD